MNKTSTSKKYSRKDNRGGPGHPAKIDTSDIPELGPAFFANAITVPGNLREIDVRTLGIGANKQMISLRVDTDVLDYFRNKGKGYQRMMNFALRAFMWREQQADASERGVKRQPRGAGKKSSGRRASGTEG